MRPRALFVCTIELTARAFLLPLAAALRQKGWDVDVAAAGARSGSLPLHFDECHEVPWSRNPLSLRANLAGFQAIKRIVDRGAYDVVHVHTPVAAFLTRLALLGNRGACAPHLMYTAHGFHFQPSAFWSGLPFLVAETLAASRTDTLVVMNDTDCASARAYGLSRRGTLERIHGIGVDLDHYTVEDASPVSRDIRKELRVPDGAPVCLAVGELIARKRHHDLIDAFAGLHDQRARLIIVGDGPLRGRLEALCRERHCSEAVSLVGRENDVRPYFRAADVFVMPSEQEGLPRAMMESMAMGVAAIGTDIRGIRDLLAPDCGVLVPVGDHRALTAAMRRLIGSSGLRAGFSANASVRVQRYALSTVTPAYVHVYQQIMERRAREQRVAGDARVAVSGGSTLVRARASARGAGTRAGRRFASAVKRGMDCVLALLLLLLLSPLMGAVALVIRWKVGAPVLFRQTRPGLAGRQFECLKFRTMTDRCDASGRLLPDAERLTPFGRFLRSSSIDELPELWNVFKGDMSLVGPRPLLVQYLGRYSPEQARRHDVRPGITGLAQVSGRNTLTWQEKFALDVRYVESWSFWLDMKILAVTIWNVIARRGINEPGQATAQEFMGNATS